MIKIIVLLKRRAELSQAEFIAYWRDVHSRVASESPGFKAHMGRYVQNYPIAGLSPENEFSGVVECWFDTREDMMRCTDNYYYKSIVRDDEEKFIDWSSVLHFVVEENVVYDRCTLTEAGEPH